VWKSVLPAGIQRQKRKFQRWESVRKRIASLVEVSGRAGLVAGAGISVAVAVMVLKYCAYLWTGSVALYSDALESVVNVLTAVAALAAIIVSAQPADRNHPFGHHKAEYLSAVLEGALITVAALLILREVYLAFVGEHVLEATGVGLTFTVVATVLNGMWSWYLVTRGRALRSPALVADGWHLFTDVLTSLGVMAGLVLSVLTGFTTLDLLLALAVAGYILWSGYRIVVASMGGLMDEAVNADIEVRIHEAIRKSGGGALQAHDIRARQAGRATFIEFHLVVPAMMTVLESHDICDRLEEALESEIEGSDVVIHVEPEHKVKSGGEIDL
jgi:cation diffusion facilitator family transporter